jgi:hypothetical protein
MPRIVTALAAAAVALAAAGEARAGGFDLNGIWSPVGVALGGSFNGQDRGGFFLGPEASVVYFSDGVWAGGFADVLWDFGSDQLRHTIGPELGFGPLGVDFGYLGVLQDGDYRPGYAARGMLTFSLISVYGRYGHVFDDAPIPTFGEVGVLLKVPIPVKLEPRRLPPPPPPPPPRPDGVAVPLPDGEVAVPLPTPPAEPPRDFAEPPPSPPKPVAPPQR